MNAAVHGGNKPPLMDAFDYQASRQARLVEYTGDPNNGLVQHLNGCKQLDHRIVHSYLFRCLVISSSVFKPLLNYRLEHSKWELLKLGIIKCSEIDGIWFVDFRFRALTVVQNFNGSLI